LKADQTGRSTGRIKQTKITRIEGQFAPRLIEMLESPANRVLSLAAKRALERIEIEHARHGGKENGSLPVTFADFEEFGINRRSIAPAIRELEALGFIEITQHGTAGNAQYRRPTLFRITYQFSGSTKPTNDWRRFDSVEEAERVAEAARSGSVIIGSKKRVARAA
jgi:DNA-binding transcriptional MocR family regulator